MKKKKVLLTGGSGFIGKNIIEQLGSTHDFLIPTAAELDLLDQAAIKQFFANHDVDIVIHAANIGGYGPALSSSQSTIGNMLMFFNLVEQLTVNQRMIFLGSGAEYDKRRDLVGVDEEDFGQHIPTDNYGFAKYVCAKYIQIASNIVNLRLFGIYGKYEEPFRLISSAIINALNDQPIILRQNTHFDYLYVDDLVKIINHFIVYKPLHTCYNVASGNRVDLVTLANMAKQSIGYKGEVVVEQEGLGREYTANIDRLKKEINVPLTPIEIGIGHLVNYYKTKKIT